MNHVSVKTRQHRWSGRRVMFDDADWDRLPDRLVTSPHSHTEQHGQINALRRAVETNLTARQRDVFVAVALNEVPIDVVAARLDSNRGAIYKILFDARTKLREPSRSGVSSRGDEHAVTKKLTLTDLLLADARDPGCEAGFDYIDQYVELELAGKDPVGLNPGLTVHLRSCSACQLDHDGILEAAHTEA
jgi:hypothetical protein